MSNGVLYMGFKLNQANIERLYCVNKAQPQKQCHGKCHLNKQLVENNRPHDEPTPTSSLEESFKISLFHEPIVQLPARIAAFSSEVKFRESATLNSRLFGTSLFQPPDSQRLSC
jgi:hypothetical protein